MILIGYDGSADAQAAIEQAGKLFPAQRVIILTAWQRFTQTMIHAGAGLAGAPSVANVDEIDQAAEAAADERAEEGVELARQAGLDARRRTVAVTSTVSETILRHAEAVDAEAIVLGSRGLTGLKSFLIGSVSHAVLTHTDRPVIVVPAPDVARSRREHLLDALSV